MWPVAIDEPLVVSDVLSACSIGGRLLFLLLDVPGVAGLLWRWATICVQPPS